MCSTLHIFFFFTFQQKLVFTSIYNSRWYKFDIKSRKYLILILIRSKKMTLLNGGKMYYLCNQSFIMVRSFHFSLILRILHYHLTNTDKIDIKIL